MPEIASNYFNSIVSFSGKFGLNVKDHNRLIYLIFFFLIYSWWNCLGRFRGCGLVGEVRHWREVLRGKDSHHFKFKLSASCPEFQKYALRPCSCTMPPLGH